jgi:prepilin-type N-terminal cleavage/methylation domain-containing protein
MRKSIISNILLVNNTKGLTLVEVMMTLLIFATVLAVINNVFFTTQGLYSVTSQRADMQMNSRSGLGVMVTEIRAAGCDPAQIGVVGIVSATADTIRVRSDLDGNGAITTNEPSEDIRYFYDADTRTIFRDPGTGPVAMVPNVESLIFSYFDRDNQPLFPLPLDPAAAAMVRSVGITITSETPRGGAMDASTRIALRNLGG